MMFHERNAERLFLPQITVPHRRIDGVRAVIRPGSGSFASKPLGRSSMINGQLPRHKE